MENLDRKRRRAVAQCLAWTIQERRMTPPSMIGRAFRSTAGAPEMSVIHPARPDADADRLLSPDEAVNFLGRGIEKRTLANWRAQRRGGGGGGGGGGRGAALASRARRHPP